MKTKIFTFFLALAASVGTMFAWDYEHVQIGDLYYNLDATNHTAEVTSQNSSFPYWSTSITTANIPSSVEYNSIPYSVTSIGDSAFDGCSGLTSVTIPNSVTSIGYAAFAYCSGLTSVTIGNSVTSIGESAFYGCDGLTSVTIPNSVKSIGKSAFNGCTGLTSIEIPNSVTSIGEWAFIDCSGLTSVTIGNSVTSIGEWAFYGCSGLTSVTIGNSVTSIGYAAFKNCSGLTSVTIGNSVTSIGDYAFDGCTGLTKVNITDIAAWCNIAFGDYGGNPLLYTHHLYVNDVEVTNLVIPEGVTSIGEWAFWGCSGLTSVTIPNSVTSIGDYAFIDCSGLTKVNITDIAAWCNIAFSGHGGGNPLVYAQHLYVNDVEVTNLVIPEGVTSIGKFAFYGCTGLTSVTIGNSVTSIGDNAFIYCSGLTSVTIGNSVTSIGDYAFFYCSGLTSVTIGNSVTSIGGGAFISCSGLTSITIPNSVTSIGGGAFISCSGLTSIYNYSPAPQVIDNEVFGGAEFEEDGIKYGPVDKSLCKLYVPQESINFYKVALIWRDFKNILPIGAQTVDVTTTTVTPSATTADIAWPQVSGAASYELVIKDKNGNVVCTLVFDAEGRLTSINFAAPGKNNNRQQTQTAGFAFSVTGLESGTTYNYTLTAKDNNGKVLSTETGTFTTEGAPQGVEDVLSDQVQSTKVVRDNQVLILRGEKTYTITGQEVK